MNDHVKETITSFQSILEKFDIRKDLVLDTMEALPLYEMYFEDELSNGPDASYTRYAIVAGSSENIQRIAKEYIDKVVDESNAQEVPFLTGYRKVADIPVFLNTIKKLQAKEATEVARSLSMSLGIPKEKLEDATRKALKSR